MITEFKSSAKRRKREHQQQEQNARAGILGRVVPFLQFKFLRIYPGRHY